MKEFNNNLVIRFSANGKTIRQRIDADKIHTDNYKREWTFLFWRDGIRYKVTGDIDSDGDFRTDGPINKEGRMARFFIETVIPECRHIDDIDIVATDIPMTSGRMYITVQIDYEREANEDDGQVRQDIMSETSYGFTVGSHLPFRITDTQILGEND